MPLPSTARPAVLAQHPWMASGSMGRELSRFLLFWAVLMLYAPVIWFELLHLDDGYYLFLNEHVLGGVSWSGVVWAWTALHGGVSYYQPLAWMSHQLDMMLFGLSAGAHHFSGKAGPSHIDVFPGVRGLGEISGEESGAASHQAEQNAQRQPAMIEKQMPGWKRRCSPFST